MPSAHPTREQIVDEFGELDARLALLTPRHKALKSQILDWYDGQDAEQPFQAHGLEWTVQISARANKRTVVAPAKLWNLLVTRMGLRKLINAITIPLTLVDEQTDLEERTGLIHEDRIGARTIKAIAAVPAPPPAAVKAA